MRQTISRGAGANLAQQLKEVEMDCYRYEAQCCRLRKTLTSAPILPLVSLRRSQWKQGPFQDLYSAFFRAWSLSLVKQRRHVFFVKMDALHNSRSVRRAPKRGTGWQSCLPCDLHHAGHACRYPLFASSRTPANRNAITVLDTLLGKP
jgi:hypothetical protein